MTIHVINFQGMTPLNPIGRRAKNIGHAVEEIQARHEILDNPLLTNRLAANPRTAAIDHSCMMSKLQDSRPPSQSWHFFGTNCLTR